MPFQSQEPLVQVLNNYDLQVVGIKNETFKEKKGVWWVETNKGKKVLKKISNSEQTLKYILSTIGHLAKNGIHFPPLIKTRDGNDYVNIDATCYILSDAVQGRSPSYDQEKELALIMKELARFHRASYGFKPLPGTKPKIHLGMWIEDYTQQLEDMNGFYQQEVAKTNDNQMGKLITEAFPYFYARAQKAIESLKGPEYSGWVEKASQSGALCHQDFAAGNLILNTAGQIFVLDTDSITLDIPARDLRKILCKVMKRVGKWDVELTKKMLRTYQSENPLSPDEWKVVLFDLKFPHLFLGAMNKYYYQRDKEWTPDKYFKRIAEMAAFEKTFNPIENQFESLIPQ